MPSPVNVSVLMSTYRCETSENLDCSLASMFQQTRPPDQLVLVVDGPVDEAQDAVIKKYSADCRVPTMTIVRSHENGGLASALSAGLSYCHHPWIMRMDSDDIAAPDRVVVQTDFLRENPDVDMLFSWCEEFFSDTSATRIKSSPITHDAILAALRWRNVIAHPGVVVRKEAILRAGGYRADFPLLEDWDLWVRLALAGTRFAAIPKCLIAVRSGRKQAARRGGWRYLTNEMKFRVFCWRAGFLTLGQFLGVSVAYACFRLLGPSIRSQVYHLVRAAGEPAPAH